MIIQVHFLDHIGHGVFWDSCYEFEKNLIGEGPKASLKRQQSWFFLILKKGITAQLTSGKSQVNFLNWIGFCCMLLGNRYLHVCKQKQTFFLYFTIIFQLSIYVLLYYYTTIWIWGVVCIYIFEYSRQNININKYCLKIVNTNYKYKIKVISVSHNL